MGRGKEIDIKYTMPDKAKKVVNFQDGTELCIE